MSWHLTSGRAFDVTVPGDTVIVYEIDPGRPGQTLATKAKPLPPAGAKVDGAAITLKLQIPDEAMKRYELIVQPWAMTDAELTVDDKPLAARQSSRDARWSIHAFDLAGYRGKTVSLRAVLKHDASASRKPATVLTEAWVIADRPVSAEPAPKDQHLPKAISQNFRRVTQNVLTKQKVPLSP
jgi:hypothetical protein